MAGVHVIKKFFTLVLACISFSVQAQPTDSLNTENAQSSGITEPSTEKLVYMFEINEGIFPPAWRKFERAMNEADSLQADAILMRLNTYGGAVDVADDMRTRLLNTDRKVIVFILNNAASAGALISIACDSIYMTPESTIGAAVVVDQEGGAAGEKYQSYFREKFRATAETKGRDPDIAEAMVNPDVEIDGVIDSGKILTFTASRALAFNFCDGIVKTNKEALEMAGITNYRIVEFESTFVDNVIRFFTNPVVSGILITVIFFGIFFELQSPGVGFPLVAAIIAAILYFTPLYMDGLAENWEILLFIVGLILLGVELFVLPGFGVAGLSGILLIFMGLLLSLLQNIRFDFTFTGIGDFAQSFFVVVSGLIATIILALLLGRKFHTSPLTRALIFKDTQQASEGYDVDAFRGMDLLHKSGITVTPLRPSGKIEIDGERYDAVTAGEYIEKDIEIVVLRAKGTSLLVQQA